MRIVIIEDECISAEDLVNCIKSIRPDYTIIKILNSVVESIEFFKTKQAYDLIFADIQLGDGQSFDIFKKVRLNSPVIFCTAFENYALEAFKVNGIDYILKPFDNLMVEKAIKKFEFLVNKFQNYKNDIESGKIEKLLNYFDSQQDKRKKSILVKVKEKIIPIKYEEIAVFFIKDNLLRLNCFDGRSFQVNKTLDEIEKTTDNSFFRVNRQLIIHRNAIKDVSEFENRKIQVTLNITFSNKIIISKEKSSAFLEWL